MIRYLCLTLTLSFSVFIGDRSLSVPKTASAGDAHPAQQPLGRVAIVGFSPSANKPVDVSLYEALSRDPRIAVLDPSMVGPALVGIGYDGSINMTRDQARKLGGAIGCDFFIIGKSETLTRSAFEKESHDQAYAGVMIVDGRSGALAAFDLISDNARTKEAALHALLKNLEARASGYVDRMVQIRSRDRGSRSTDSVMGEIIEDAPGEDSPRSIGFKAPELLNRAKPEYTTEAEMADITATVEAMVVFRSNGEVGPIEITRWAGFGLDESSERAIRKLQFKPASRDGVPINVRAMIRYNFRRVTEPPTKPDQPDSKPPEKPERDLRQIFKPTYRHP